MAGDIRFGGGINIGMHWCNNLDPRPTSTICPIWSIFNWRRNFNFDWNVLFAIITTHAYQGIKQMRMKLRIFSTLASLMTTITMAQAINAPVPFSNHGQIQNVQNYSTNPFWSPNSPYNQRLPQPIYVQGAALDSGECQRTVSALIESYCLSQNYCRDISLTDARPALMMQLSNMPNNNYLSACSGYIDTEFAAYKSRHVTAAPTAFPTAFPTGGVPNQNATENEFKIKNPYAPVAPDWAIEMKKRQQELKDLQSQNSTGTPGVVRADFPETIADVSSADRLSNAAAGYEPFKDANVYNSIKIESEEAYLARRQELLAANQVAVATAGTTSTPGATPDKPGSNTSGGGNNTTTTPIVSETGATTQYLDQLAMDNNPGMSTTGSTISAALSAGAAGFATGALATSWTGPWAIAGGIVGAISAGAAALMSDSDVLVDPVTGKRVGCNVGFESADREVDTGGYMFCGQYKVDANGNATLTGYVPGYARQCMQNEGSPTAQKNNTFSWFLKDFWNKDCVMRLCDNTPTPPENPNNVNWTPDETNVCWSWSSKQ